MTLEPDFADFLDALARHRVEFVIVGAYALAHHGSPRATRDFDVWVRPTPENARSVLRALADFGAPSVAKEEDILTGKVIQLGVEPVRIDIISDLSGVGAAEIWDGRENGDVGGRRVAFIGRKTYVKNKLAAGRRKDLSDLEALGELPPDTPR
jgi:hypothetical protein